MPHRSRTFWRYAAAVTLAAAIPAAAGWLARSMGGGDAAALAAFILAALFVSAFLAWWLARPWAMLDAWLDAPGEDRPAAFPWDGAAGRISAWREDADSRLQAAETEMDRLRTVLNAMADGVLVADAERRVVLLNRTAEALLGVARDEAMGRTVIECTLSPELDRAVGAALETGATRAADLDLVYPRSRRVHALANSSGEGPRRAAVVVLRDQTDAARLDAVRRDFVANVSHELRTPVTAIRGMAESLLDGAMDDPALAPAFLKHILAASARLVALVDDLLNLARAESGLNAERAALRLAPLARTVLAGLEPMSAGKGLEVHVDIPENLRVWSDIESVRQVLGNLLDNAVKYTPEGGRVSVSAEGENGMVRVLVSDTGPGIAPEHHSRIFERFYRVDRARSRAVGGTGLGLSIVRHLVEGAGGSVGVESALGRGAMFTFTLPAPPAS